MRLNLFHGIRLLFQKAVRSVVNRFVNVEDVLEDTVDRMQGAIRGLKVEMAELVVLKNRTETQLADATISSGLRELLKTQLLQQEMRLDQISMQVAQLESRMSVIRAQKTDLVNRARLVEAKDRIQGVLDSIGVVSMDETFTEIDDKLSHRMAVQDVLEDINKGKYLPPQV